MISSRKKILYASLLACATFCSSGAFAQAAPPAPPDAGSGPIAPPRHGGHNDMAQRMQRMEAHHAKRMADLKAKLKLTPAQDGAWTTFAAAQQPPARPAGDPSARWAEFQKMTTPQRLDQMQQRQTERAAHMTQRADATRAFYAQLTPDQQKVFDTESLPHFGPGGPRGPGGPGGPGGRHQPPAPPTKG